MKSKTFLTGLIFLSLFIFPKSVFAALDITVQPTFFDYSPKPGQSINEKVVLSNKSSSSISLGVSINRMASNAQNDIVPEEIPSSDPDNQWFSFKSAQITIPAGEAVEVPFTINVPQDSGFSKYFALVFSTQTAKTLSGASVQGNVLVPVLLNIQKEGAISKADIANFSVKNFVTEYLPVEFSLTLNNTGNYHLIPVGNIFIRAAGGKEDLDRLDINSSAGRILPGASRTFTANWNDGFITRSKDGQLSFNWNKLTDFRFGKYSAHALVIYEDNGKDIPLESTITFWVVPYTAIIGLIIVVLTFVIATNFIFKAMVKKAAKNLSSSTK